MTQELFQRLFRLYQILIDSKGLFHQEGTNSKHEENDRIGIFLEEKETLEILESISKSDLTFRREGSSSIEEYSRELMKIGNLTFSLPWDFSTVILLYLVTCFKKDMLEYFRRLKDLRQDPKIKYNPNPGVYMIESNYYASIENQFEDIEHYGFFYYLFSREYFWSISINAFGFLVIDEKLITNYINAADTLDFSSWDLFPFPKSTKMKYGFE